MQIEQTYFLEAITCRSLHPFQTIYLLITLFVCWYEHISVKTLQPWIIIEGCSIHIENFGVFVYAFKLFV